jgi:hypothetical protein
MLFITDINFSLFSSDDEGLLYTSQSYLHIMYYYFTPYMASSEFEAYLSLENPDVIGLCEIFPKNAVDKHNIENINLNGYKCI